MRLYIRIRQAYYNTAHIRILGVVNRDMLRFTNLSVSALVAVHALLVGLEVGVAHQAIEVTHVTCICVYVYMCIVTVCL